METSTESFLLALNYHDRGGRNGGHDDQHHGIRRNYCNRYSHIKVEFRTKEREQQRKPRIVVVVQLTIIKVVNTPATDYNEFLQFKVAHQQPSSTTVV